MFWKIARAGALCLVPLLVPTAWAQSAPEFSVHPSHERGLSDNTAYEIGVTDHINLFTGNLVLTVPIGQRYPVNGGFSWGLSLTYNANLWDWQEEDTVCPDPSGNPQTIAAATPNRMSNAGLGWLLTPGQLLSGKVTPIPDAESYSFIAPDGSTHELRDPVIDGLAPVGGILYGQNGSQLRLKQKDCPFTAAVGWNSSNPPVPTPSNVCYDLERSDGTVLHFDYKGDCTGIEDALGNGIAISKTLNATTNIEEWVFEDSVNSRTATVKLEPGYGGDRRIAEVRLPVFGDDAGTATGIYTFNYRAGGFVLPEHSESYGDCVTPDEFQVDLLESIDLPETQGVAVPRLRYTFEYYPRALLNDLDGMVKAVVLPAGGRYEWDFVNTAPIDTGPDFNHPDTPVPFLVHRYGVAEKRQYDLPGTGSPSELLGTWKYQYRINELDLDQALGGRSQMAYTRVEEPGGRVRYHYFNLREHEGSGAVGLPFNPLQEDPEEAGSGRYLSTVVVDEDRAVRGSANVYAPPDEPMEATYLRYQHSSCTSCPSGFYYGLYPEQRRTYYFEKLRGTSTNPCDDPHRQAQNANHFSQVTYSDHAGWGRFRKVEQEGTLDDEDEQETYTAYRNEATLPTGSTWILGISSHAWVESDAGASNTSEVVYDETTGLVLRRRTLKSEQTPGGTTLSSLSRSNKDLIVVYGYDGQGNLIQEDYYGGDRQTVSTAGLKTLTLPSGGPVYRTLHEYDFGVRSKTTRVDPHESNAVVLQVEDLVIDSATGLVSSATTATGLMTNYTFDSLGRIVKIEPSADADYVFSYIPRSGATGARAKVERTHASSTLLHSERAFDGFGRVVKELSRLPGAVESDRWTEYDELGRRSHVTTLQATGTTPRTKTTFEYDKLGRQCRETKPDGSRIKTYHKGIERTRRVTSIQKVDGVGNQLREYEYDIHGRLQSVRENSAPGDSAVKTFYHYDAAGRLERVETDTPSGSSLPQQVRRFDYDGRGFLWQECHPEKIDLPGDPDGCVDYRQYDALGNPETRTDGPFSLEYHYDAIGRLTQVEEPGVGLLKEYFYGREDQPGNLLSGRLHQAKRHNRVQGTDYVVTETYSYGGPEGRLSDRRTTVRDLSGDSAGSQWFDQSFTYDELGNLESQAYPECLHAVCGGTDPSRSVQYDYDQGLLVAVPAFAPSISYHRNGSLEQVSHSNGLADITDLDPSWLPRPAEIRTEPTGGGMELWSTGPFSYDGSGNVSGIGNDHYSYDEASRLVKAEVENAGSTTLQIFSYDRFGNRTLQVAGGTVPDLPFDASTNRFNNPIGSTTYQYDGAGNLTAWTGGTATFDATGMVTATSGLQKNHFYLYTPSDERLATIDMVQTPPAIRWTLRGASEKVLRTFDSEWKAVSLGDEGFTHDIVEWSWQKDYVYRGTSLLAATVSKPTGGEEIHHFHLDHLGTPRLKTSEQGVEMVQHKYLPFGEELTNVALDNEVMQFTSHERDRTPGDWDNVLDYMHARYYAPKFGRFLSLDKVLGTPEVPQSWNRYAYVAGSPIGFVDPDGHLRRRLDGSLYADFGEVVGVGHGGAPDLIFAVRQATLYTDRGDAIEASTVLAGGEDAGAIYSRSSRRLEARRPDKGNPRCTDCHGVTFADGNFWINDDQVETILAGDGYQEVAAGGAKKGDVAVYRKDGEVVHSATVSTVGKDGGVKTVSGLGGLQTKVTEQPVGPGPGAAWPSQEGVTVQYYRQAPSVDENEQ